MRCVLHSRLHFPELRRKDGSRQRYSYTYIRKLARSANHGDLARFEHDGAPERRADRRARCRPRSIAQLKRFGGQKMAPARVADVKPIEVQFQQTEELYWCACGRSDSQPFCDGSHAGSEFTPVAFTGEKDETIQKRARNWRPCWNNRRPKEKYGSSAKTVKNSSSNRQKNQNSLWISKG